MRRLLSNKQAQQLSCMLKIYLYGDSLAGVFLIRRCVFNSAGEKYTFRM